MCRLAADGSTDFLIRDLALSITGGLKQKDYQGEACACLNWVRDRIRYVRDMALAEVLQIPQVTLPAGLSGIGRGQGDCDDKSILLAAMLASIGHRVRFIAIAFEPETYSHVWVQDAVGGQWLDLEPTEPLPCGARIPGTGAVDYMTREL